MNAQATVAGNGELVIAVDEVADIEGFCFDLGELIDIKKALANASDE